MAFSKVRPGRILFCRSIPCPPEIHMLGNLPFDEAVVEPRILVAEERIQNGGLAGVFSRLAGGAGFRGPPGGWKKNA